MISYIVVDGSLSVTTKHLGWNLQKCLQNIILDFIATQFQRSLSIRAKKGSYFLGFMRLF